MTDIIYSAEICRKVPTINHLEPEKVNDNHQEELYQVTPEELKENRRLLQIQGRDPRSRTRWSDPVRGRIGPWIPGPGR